MRFVIHTWILEFTVHLTFYRIFPVDLSNPMAYRLFGIAGTFYMIKSKNYLAHIWPLLALISVASTCLRTHSDNLEKVGQYHLDMPEPSGLALDPDGQHLWIVSDRDDNVFKTDLKGEIVDDFDTNSKDSEGIAISADGKTIYVLDESKKKIRLYSNTGEEGKTIDLDIDADKNSGPEGLDIAPGTGNLWVANEKHPRILIELDVNGNEIRRMDIEGLNDLSAVAIDNDGKSLWLLSDIDQKLIHAEITGKIIETYAMDIDQMEGLAIDFENKRIFIVSDKEEELHIFKYNN